MSETVLWIFNWMPDIDEAEKAYIASRGIDPEQVKHLLKWESGTAVKCKITWFTKKNDIDFVNIQTRYIEAGKKERFKTLPDHKATGLFIDKIDPKKDYLLVVEWMFDFLSLRQFDTNVIWLFNAVSVEAFEFLKYVVEKKNIKKVIYVNDNDPAWIESGDRLLKIIESACLLDIKQFWEIKDVNDLVASGIFDYGIFLEICLERRDEAQKEKLQEIEDEKNEAFEKVKNISDIHKNWKTIEYPVDNLNTGLWLIKGDELSIIIGSPNCWKTTFAFLMALHNLEKWHKVWFLSYEMPFGDIIDQYNLRRIPWWMDRFEQSRLTDEDEIQLREAKEKIMKHKNFYSYDGSKVGLEEMKEHLRKLIAVWVSCIFIDNLIKIRRTNSELSDNQWVIEELYTTCHNKDQNVSIILLHHTDKMSGITNKLSYRWTGDVQIKPDNMFYLQRPWLTVKDEEDDQYSRAELMMRKEKQRYGISFVNKKESVYFFKWAYYTLDEYIKLQG